MTTDDSQTGGLRRRRFLTTVLGLSAVGTAGCIGGVPERGRRPFADNPVSKRISERPRRGRARSETEVTLVLFDDPSCPYCAEFHRTTYKRIVSEWVETGRATLFNRSYYFVEPWGRKATHALVEAHSRAPASYWKLKARYYANRTALTGENIIERTATMADGLAVDAEALTAAIRTRAHESAIAADDAAGSAAGATGVPTVFVFVDGAFTTTLGNDSFEAYRGAIRSDG